MTSGAFTDALKSDKKRRRKKRVLCLRGKQVAKNSSWTRQNKTHTHAQTQTPTPLSPSLLQYPQSRPALQAFYYQFTHFSPFFVVAVGSHPENNHLIFDLVALPLTCGTASFLCNSHRQLHCALQGTGVSIPGVALPRATAPTQAR